MFIFKKVPLSDKVEKFCGSGQVIDDNNKAKGL